METLNQIRGFLRLPPKTDVSSETLDDTIKRFDTRISEWESQVKEQTDIFLGNSQQVPSAVIRAMQARRGHALYLKALEELKKFDKDPSKGNIEEQYGAVMEITDLFLILGKVVDAIAEIDAADEEMNVVPNRIFGSMQGKLSPQELMGLRQRLQQSKDRWWSIKMCAYVAHGDFPRLTEMFRSQMVSFEKVPFDWPPTWGNRPQNNQWLAEAQTFPLVDQIMNFSVPKLNQFLTATVAELAARTNNSEIYAKLEQSQLMSGVATRRVNQMGQYHLRLAFAYLQQGDNAAAKKQFARAVKPFGLDIPHSHRATAEYYEKLLKMNDP